MSESSAVTPQTPTSILLLKTRSLPTDPYAEHFASLTAFDDPIFVPVLGHAPNQQNLSRVKTLLLERRLHVEYGGLVFTSQRAVEGFARVVGELDRERESDAVKGEEAPSTTPSSTTASTLDDPFPFYVVGPATALSLHNLIRSSPLLTAQLNPEILGAEAGNGEALSHFILTHYNAAHRRRYFELYEAPRLPFIPLIGDRSEQYGTRGRLEKDDVRLRRNPLLFLVGEKRRDVIPRTLMSETDLKEGERIQVEEIEVYSTVVVESFEHDFKRSIETFQDAAQGSNNSPRRQVVIVVFSPSGCEAMLRVLRALGEAERRRFVVVSIGPTTRDYLKETFGFEVEVCAKTPSPEGVAEGVLDYLSRKA